MYRSPYGFFAFFLLVCLLLVVSSPGHGQEITISEEMWQDFKMEYGRLKSHNEYLLVSLDSSASIVTDLRVNSATLWLQLNTAKNESAILSQNLKSAETQAEQLGNQLTLSENGLSELKNSIRRQKTKAYFIGGAVGLGVGIIAGVILGVYIG